MPVKHKIVKIIPDKALPPIVETPRTSAKSYRSKRTTPSPTKTQPPLAKTPPSPAKSPENPFRKQTRRPSVSSPTRRNSRVSDNDFPDADESFKKELARRESGFNLFPSGKRPSFGSVGTRITAILKAKNAFNKFRRQSRDAHEESLATFDDDVDAKSFEIKELPKEPRFSSMLSIEAQYAMLKGYEDVVYSNMVNTFPESIHKLRRSKTPQERINVANVCISGNVPVNNIQVSSSSDTKMDILDSDGNNTGNSRSRDYQMTSTPTSDKDVTRGHRIVMTSPDGNDELMEENDNYIMDNGESNRNLLLPKLPVMDQQKLVMTYRAQSAMDILDTLRQKQGLNRLSPRVTAALQTEPVLEYNTWSYVWSKEFESKPNDTDSLNVNVLRNH